MSAVGVPSPSGFRRVGLVVGVLAIVAVGGIALRNLFRGDGPPPLDFSAFWVAGDLNLRGQNPYDAKTVRESQKRIGLGTDTATMMWNPPWVLALVMPFGLFPFATAYGLWALVHIGLLILATELLWRGFAPEDPIRRADHMRRRWVAYLFALTFVPTTYLIGIGQITAVVLAGLAGFLVLARNARPLAAGAAVAVTAAKPHLLTVFAAWLLLESLRSRSGRLVVLGGVLVGAAACLASTLTNPDVWAQYVRAVTAPPDENHYSTANWATPVIASWIRCALPGQPFWVQFVPTALAVAAFAAWYLSRDRRPFGEAERDTILPWTVGLSLLVAPYGAWPFDLVLLLVPILATAARVARAPNPTAVWIGIGWLAAVNAVLLVMMIRVASSELYVWVTPAVLIGTAAVSRLAARPTGALVPAVN
jgi:hypothetical protein